MSPTIPPHPYVRGKGKGEEEGDFAVWKLRNEIMSEKQESKSDSECDIHVKVNGGDERRGRRVRSDDEVVRRSRMYERMYHEGHKDEVFTLTDDTDADVSEDNSRNERSEEDPLHSIAVRGRQEDYVPALLVFQQYFRPGLKQNIYFYIVHLNLQHIFSIVNMCKCEVFHCKM